VLELNLPIFNPSNAFLFVSYQLIVPHAKTALLLVVSWDCSVWSVNLDQWPHLS